MQPTSCLVRPHPYSVRATTTASHPQLRDLLVHTPEAGNAVALVCYDSVCSVDLYAARPPEYTPLKFSPSTISTGCGLVAVGGQSSELALKSATPGADWCHQYLPATSTASSTGVRTLHSGSINNSIHIAPSPHSPATPRLLVSSNDEAIRVFDVAGRPPDFRAAKRRRERERRTRGSVVDASWAAERWSRSDECFLDSDGDGGSPVEECPSFDEGGECFLVPVPSVDIRLRTAVNHCSVSPDGKWLVAVGDTNEVFLYDTRAAGYELAHVFTASDDASFSTDWSEDNVTFAVASQDGFVHVYDLRALPSSSRPASPTLRGAHSAPRKVAELRTTQAGPPGAARKVRFSPGGKRIDAGLMAFTEHRNRVHVVDARTFETFQILDVPSSSPSSSSVSSSPPPLRPRPQPPPRRPARPPPPPRLPSGTHTPRDERERDALEREMRERSERRFAEEEARLREWRVEAAERGREVIEGDGDARMREEEEAARESGESDEEGDAEEEEDDDDDDSAGSSVNTTRPRRFEPASAAAAHTSAVSAVLDDATFRSAATTLRLAFASDFAPPRAGPPLPAEPPAEPLIRRNFPGYAPLTLSSAPAPSRIPAYASPPAALSSSLLSAGRTPASFYYATYLPPPSMPSFPAPAHTSTIGAGAGAGGAYYPASAYFPLDSAPGDLLGLDWDERGERLFVATAERVWEWEVDRDARRGSAAWGVI
ncbi:hypothetical protein JCM10450v2_006218 [Rhodotorula kratochvilovae]